MIEIDQVRMKVSFISLPYGRNTQNSYDHATCPQIVTLVSLDPVRWTEEVAD